MAPPPVKSIVPEHCSGSAFCFEPGVLHVSKDGSGYIAVDEDDWILEDDRCEGPDGPEGSVHWITHISADQMEALRDFLNGAPRQPQPSVAGAPEQLMPIEDIRDLDAVVHALGIEDSDVTPAEAVDELKSRIRELESAAHSFQCNAEPSWQPIETAPHGRRVLLGWSDWRDGTWCVEVGCASWGTRTGAFSNMSAHGSATHWMPLPDVPAALARAKQEGE